MNHNRVEEKSYNQESEGILKKAIEKLESLWIQESNTRTISEDITALRDRLLFSGNLRLVLKRCCFSYYEFAEELGISDKKMVSWVRAEVMPDEAEVNEIAEFLGLDAAFFYNPISQNEDLLYGLPMYIYRLDSAAEWYRFKPKSLEEPKYLLEKNHYPKADYLEEKKRFYETAVRRYIAAVEDSSKSTLYVDKENTYRRGREYMHICTNLYNACFEAPMEDKTVYYDAVKCILKDLTKIIKGEFGDERLEKALKQFVDTMSAEGNQDSE